MRSVILSLLTLVLTAAFLLGPVLAGEAPDKKEEGEIPENEILEKEAKALEAYEKKDYVEVFKIFAELYGRGVKVAERSSGRMFITNSLNEAIRLEDRDEARRVLESFLAFDFGAPADWIYGAGYALTRDLCTARLKLDKVEAMAVEYMKIHEKAIEGKDREKPEDRKDILDHGRFVELVAYAHFAAGNFDPKTNRFVQAGVSAVKFRDITEESGCKGVEAVRLAVADLDNDGKEDLLINGHRVLRNLGKGKFEDATEASGLPEARMGLASDLNNDGLVDVVQVDQKEERVLLNDGTGEFKAVENAGLVADDFLTNGMTLADFNRDGLVDLYLSKSAPKDHTSSKPVRVTYDLLYLNRKQGRFEESGETAGIRKAPSMLGRGVTAADVDGDGDLDVYVCNHNYHFDKNFLWLNGGKGDFTETGEAWKAAGTPKKYGEKTYHGHSNGAAFGDVDGDGDLDLFVANVCRPEHYDIVGPPMLLVNGGNGFEDRFVSSGVAFHSSIFDCSMVDFDNDGFLDVYLSATGEARQSFLYRNKGDGTFEDVTWPSRSPVFEAFCHAWFDFDQDGDLDLAVATKKGLCILKNGGSRRNGWMEFKLFGKESNACGIGTRIIVRAGKKTFLRELSCGRGNSSQDSLIVHVGLGRFKGTVDVEVRWPSGKVHREKMKACRRHILQEK